MENNEQMDATTSQNETSTQINYEAEYKKMLAEIDTYKADVEKYKGLKDKYASENAEYKKKELAKLSDDEKKAKEYEELMARNNEMAEQLRVIKLEKEMMAQGFTAQETSDGIKNNFSPEWLAKLVKSRVEEAVKSANANQIKDNTPAMPLDKGVSGKETQKSAFQLRQESQNQTMKEVKL